MNGLAELSGSPPSRPPSLPSLLATHSCPFLCLCGLHRNHPRFCNYVRAPPPCHLPLETLGREPCAAQLALTAQGAWSHRSPAPLPGIPAVGLVPVACAQWARAFPSFCPSQRACLENPGMMVLTVGIISTFSLKITTTCRTARMPCPPQPQSFRPRSWNNGNMEKFLSFSFRTWDR